MKCCPKCGSEDIVDTCPNMWTVRYRCSDCKAEWEMRIKNSDGKIIGCYADII